MSFEMDPSYKEVSERVQDFFAKHPDGSLQSEMVPAPGSGFVVVKAYAYRTPDDPTPGVGWAWEPVPGKTPYTKDSELMNAETSAWGRAIIAVGASTAKRIASADEVRNRQATAAPVQSGPAPLCPQCMTAGIPNPKWEAGTKRPTHICGAGCQDGKWPQGMWQDSDSKQGTAAAEQTLADAFNGGAPLPEEPPMDVPF